MQTQPPLPLAPLPTGHSPAPASDAASLFVRSNATIQDWADADHVMSLGFARGERDPYIPGSDVYLNPDTEVLAARLDKPIGAECRGHKLLLKMGWQVGEGLGKHKQGRLEPIVLKEESTGLGLGKASEYDSKIAEVTSSRKLLNSEVTESAEQIAKRESVGAAQEQTKTDVKEMNKSFFCEDCDKQYKSVSEFANHLSSYDHHHTKRLVDLKKADRARKGGVDRSKEQKKEWDALQKRSNAAAAAAAAAATASRPTAIGMVVDSSVIVPAAAAAAAAAAGAMATTATNISSSDPPIASVAPVEQRAAVKFSFGSKPKKKKP